MDFRSRGIVLIPCSENKGADQLCSYGTTDLRLCFSHMQKSGFSHVMAQMSSYDTHYIKEETNYTNSLLALLQENLEKAAFTQVEISYKFRHGAN